MRQSVCSDTHVRTARFGTGTLWGAVLCVALLAGQSFAQTQSISSRVSAPGDDVEQKRDGGLMDFGSSDLEITDEGLPQVIGMRFLDVRIPPGATILSAAIQFTVDENTTGDTSVRLFAVLSPDASAFTSDPFNLTSRPRTAFTADWDMIPPWGTVGEAGPDQRTPDLSALVQEIVNLSDWDSGSAMIFGILGNPGGRRTAESHNGVSASAPLLEVTYMTEPGLRPDPVFAAVVDDSLSIALTLSQNCNAGQEVTYTIESSDPAVAAPAETSATFPAGGRFFDKVDLAINAVGTATLTARPADGSPAECGEISVSVEVTDVQGVDLQLQTAGMEVGDSQQAQLVADYGPAGTRFRTEPAAGSTYMSSDEAVATVDANGVVTAVGVGAAEITGTNKGFSSTEAVVVAERLTRIAFLVGDTRLNEGDQAVVDHLSSLRFSGSPAQIDPAGLPPNIVPINDDDIDERAIEARFDLLIGSSTTGTRQVGGQFRCNNTPFIFWAVGLHTINREGLSDAGGTSAGHTDVDGTPLERQVDLFILDNTHPITAGLTQDDFVTVYDEPQLIAYAASGQAAVNPGALSADAASLAEYDFLEESTITIAEAGGLRFGGNSRFLARRVGLWFTDDSFGHLNQTGLTIFNNAVNWALASERRVLIPEGVNLLAARRLICPPELAGGGTNQVQLLLIGSAEFNCPVDLSDAAAGTTYDSSNPAIATVDEDGLVTSVALGTTTITVTNGGLVNTIDIEVAVEAGAPGFVTEIWQEVGFGGGNFAATEAYVEANDPTGTEVGIQVINFVDSGNPGEIAMDLPFPILPPPALGGSNQFIARMSGFIVFPAVQTIEFGVSHDDDYSLVIDGQIASESACCSSSTTFFYTPPRAGVLSFDLLFHEGSGGGFMELTQVIDGQFVLINDPNDTRSLRLFSAACVEGPTGPPPEFRQIMGGMGSAPDTFISPLGEDVAFDTIDLDLSVDSDLVSGAGMTLTANGGGNHTLTLDTPAPVGGCVTLTFDVADSATGVVATITITVCHLPLDVNQDGQVNIQDITAWGAEFNGARRAALVDTNGDGNGNVQDATAVGDNWFGRPPATKPWNGETVTP